MIAQGMRIALVEDHALLAESLLVALTTERVAVSIVPVPDTHLEAGEMLRRILAVDPAVVLLDLDLGPAGDGTVMIDPLVRAGRSVVVVTAAADPSRWGECLALGAHAVISKTARLEDIIEALRKAADGRQAISDTDRSELIQHWRRRRTLHHAHHAHLDRLTPREGEVLAALARGKRVSDIAQESYVSEATVRTQVKSILGKLGVNSQIAAVAIARDAGWHANS